MTERLREIPALVADYLERPWLRYGPISAALARALVVKERALFWDAVLQKPQGVLDGSLAVLSDRSVAYRLSGNGRRNWVWASVHAARRLLARAVSTVVVFAILSLIEVPLAGWLTAAWFFFGSRIRELVSGSPEPSGFARDAATIKQMLRAQGALWGDDVSVALARHALLVAGEAGVVWDRELWHLLADAERARDTTWQVVPRL
jgi:hypothetical protein